MTSNNDNDDFVTWLLVCFVVIVFGPGLLASFLPAATQLLVKMHILVTSEILIPIGTAGLDLPRVLILAGAALIVALVAILAVRRRISARSNDRRRA